MFLHRLFSIDICDKLLLNQISKTIGPGKVYAYGDKCTFVVSNLKEIQIIIDILTGHTLKSTKLLNIFRSSALKKLLSYIQIIKKLKILLKK